MKKIGTLNAPLSRVIASMGHTDKLIICDSGLPIPDGRNVVDLALTKNVPRFMDALRVVLEELHVEAAVVAEEMQSQSHDLYEEVREALQDVDLETIAHEEFKTLGHEENGNVTFLRTGEATPYANVMLQSGVTFG